MTPDRLHVLLRLDAAANILAGIALVLAANLLADALGLDGGWPVPVAGLALAAYGVGNLLVARRPTPGGLRGLIAVDLGFAAAVTALAVADPTGAETWMRWGLVAVADLSAVFGIAKLLVLRTGVHPAERAR